MELESYAKFEVREPLTRETLGRVVETLAQAEVPLDAKLQIVNFTNGAGVSVKATWTTTVGGEEK